MAYRSSGNDAVRRSGSHVNASGSPRSDVAASGKLSTEVSTGRVGSETSNRETLAPRMTPSSSASTPTPSNRPSPRGWRYSENPGIFSSPSTRGAVGSETSIANSGSTWRNVTT